MALALALIVTASASGQTPAPPVTPVTAPPVSLLLPNYNSVPAGEVAALEGGTKLFLGSLGVRYSTGQSGPMVLGASTDGEPFETTFKVSSLGLVYSIALLS